MAMHRFVHIGFAFPGAIKMRDLEPVMGTIGDWVRYSPLSWIVWTDMPTGSIFARLRPYLDSQDQVLIAPLNLQDSFGSLSPWIWTWINSKTTAPTISHGATLEEMLGLPKPKPSAK
jgi:hypothetical protein